jgi:hypothetical protein
MEGSFGYAQQFGHVAGRHAIVAQGVDQAADQGWLLGIELSWLAPPAAWLRVQLDLQESPPVRVDHAVVEGLAYQEGDEDAPPLLECDEASERGVPQLSAVRLVDGLGVEPGHGGQVLGGATGGEGSAHLVEGAFSPVHGLAGGIPDLRQLVELVLGEIVEHAFASIPKLVQSRSGAERSPDRGGTWPRNRPRRRATHPGRRHTETGRRCGP